MREEQRNLGLPKASNRYGDGASIVGVLIETGQRSEYYSQVGQRVNPCVRAMNIPLLIGVGEQRTRARWATAGAT